MCKEVPLWDRTVRANAMISVIAVIKLLQASFYDLRYLRSLTHNRAYRPFYVIRYQTFTIFKDNHVTLMSQMYRVSEGKQEHKFAYIGSK